MENRNAKSPAQDIDLEEVARLIETLERDLERVKAPTADVQRLRDEVAALKAVLHGPEREHHRVRDALHGLRERIDKALGEAVYEGLEISRYVSEIGRILGLG